MEAIVRTNPGALLVIIKVLAKRLRKIIQSTEEIGYWN